MVKSPRYILVLLIFMQHSVNDTVYDMSQLIPDDGVGGMSEQGSIRKLDLP